MIRINGDLRKLNTPNLTQVDIEGMLAEVMSKKQKEQLIKNKSIDFSVKANGIGIFRVNAYYQRFGLAAAFRALSESAPTLDELGLPDIFKRACTYHNGLVLITGPTGSGKSTTLASMINHINETKNLHILTLEDPIEFHHKSKSCLVNQRQLGTHFNHFSDALKASLREDPDVILIGEMRDPETMSLAITAAETGHLVFATLHTNSAAKSIDRMIDSFSAEQQAQIRVMLSESLRVVASQRLIPKKDGSGRLALHDILVVNSAVSNLIREGKIHQVPSIMQTSKKDGMQVLDQVLLEAVQSGTINGSHAYEHCHNKKLFQNYVNAEGTGIKKIKVA